MATSFEVHVDEAQPTRTYGAIRAMLDASTLADGVKARAQRTFHRLAVAEAKVHASAIDDVHFHEVGAVDAIADVVGSARRARVARRGARRVAAADGARLREGRARHASPAAARHGGVPRGARDVRRGARLRVRDADGRRNRRGARERRRRAGRRWRRSASAGGRGPRSCRDRPNVLRAVLGAPRRLRRMPHAGGGATHAVLEANVDDATGELAASWIEALLAAGALDAWATPITMKKGRPALTLSALAPLEHADAVAHAMLRETTSLGVRRYDVSRAERPRRMVEVDTPYGRIPVKVAEGPFGPPQMKPEFDACARGSARPRRARCARSCMRRRPPPTRARDSFEPRMPEPSEASEGDAPASASASSLALFDATSICSPCAPRSPGNRRTKGDKGRTMSACPQCGTVAKPTDKFCNVCGTPIAPGASAAPARACGPPALRRSRAARASRRRGPAPGGFGGPPPPAFGAPAPGRAARAARWGTTSRPGASYCAQGHPIALDQMQFNNDAYGGRARAATRRLRSRASARPPPRSRVRRAPVHRRRAFAPAAAGAASRRRSRLRRARRRAGLRARRRARLRRSAAAGRLPAAGAAGLRRSSGRAARASALPRAFGAAGQRHRARRGPREDHPRLPRRLRDQPRGDFWPLTAAALLVGRLGARRRHRHLAAGPDDLVAPRRARRRRAERRPWRSRTPARPTAPS